MIYSPKAYIATLGCDKNSVDTEIMLHSLESAGIQTLDQPENADFIIINTCAFLQESIEQSLDTFFQAVDIKKKSHHQQKVILTGCITGRFPHLDPANDLPEADFILPQAQLQNIGPFLTQKYAKNYADSPAKQSYIKVNNAQIPHYWQNSEATQLGKGYAYIKISEGCDRRCSFCIIPQIRGKTQSIGPEKIKTIIQKKSEAGIKEFNLVSQDTTGYGKDFNDPINLSDLLNQLLPIVPETSWIRLLYLYPDSINDSLLNLIKHNRALVPYFDIPMQHVSPAILKNMHRPGDKDKYLKLVNQMRNKIPDAAIRSSFIIGYPGETDQDFKMLCDFLEQAQLDKVGFFIYSDEPGTPAAMQEPKISESTKKERHQEILNLQKKISQEKLTQLVGKKAPVLIEENIDQDYIGRTIWDAPEVDGQVFLKTSKLIQTGQIIEAEITASLDYDLLAEV